ncbi:MAG: hypothetical protein HC835_18240 [Oscillatoriales cyanobacterium RM2_1_1]|nr:hypothetical protein [Oscillatoriales cyanobacterium SM2_3_0]NJO47394.1 hypothetical protein [Oscillatoriales cyanobacterium RM2_1_1]
MDSKPLTGIELIDCARANAREGVATAAKLAGYGTEIDTFQQELQQACQDIGVEIHELNELIETPKTWPVPGFEVAPDSSSDL